MASFYKDILASPKCATSIFRCEDWFDQLRLAFTGFQFLHSINQLKNGHDQIAEYLRGYSGLAYSNLAFLTEE